MTQCLNANSRCPKQLLLSTVIEPPVNNHPKCKDLVVAYGRPVVTYKNQTTGGHLLGRGLGTSTLWKTIYCMQVMQCVVPCCY